MLHKLNLSITVVDHSGLWPVVRVSLRMVSKVQLPVTQYSRRVCVCERERERERERMDMRERERERQQSGYRVKVVWDCAV